MTSLLKQRAEVLVDAVNPRDWESIPGGKSRFLKAFGLLPSVGTSEDLERILAIPRRPPLRDRTREDAVVELMNRRLRRERTDACACASLGRPCITSLKPAQAWALYEAGITGGIVGVIGVGHGKTGLDILAPLVVPNCRVAIVLAPPGLRNQFWNDYLAWREHFRVPSLVMDDGERASIVRGAPVLHFVPFSKLSRPESTALLESISPDTIIVDEAHRVKDPKAATTKRFMRYYAAHEETRLLCWSGTLTATSIKDYAHLTAFSLRWASPLPLDPSVVEEWSTALDPSESPAPAGALMRLCAPGEGLEDGYRRRLIETRGVISTTSSPVDASINLFDRGVKVPRAVKELLDRLRSPGADGGWTRPDGEELLDILEVKACARQLACGFYYRWKFPKGEPEWLIEEWFSKRKDYMREVRERLRRGTEHLDSPKLLENAARRFYAGYKGPLPVWESLAWPAWSEVAGKVYHEQDVVWVDDFLVNDAADWLAKHKGIVWYAYDAFAERVSKLSGAPKHGGGPHAGPLIDAEKGKRSILASIKAHGTGRDGLQHKFRTQLVGNPPASGAEWEQLLGRLHRIGQAADEVDCHVYRHTEEYCDALDKALRKAKYIEGTLGTHQKLLAANCDFDI